MAGRGSLSWGAKWRGGSRCACRKTGHQWYCLGALPGSSSVKRIEYRAWQRGGCTHQGIHKAQKTSVCCRCRHRRRPSWHCSQLQRAAGRRLRLPWLKPHWPLLLLALLLPLLPLLLLLLQRGWSVRDQSMPGGRRQWQRGGAGERAGRGRHGSAGRRRRGRAAGGLPYEAAAAHAAPAGHAAGADSSGGVPAKTAGAGASRRHAAPGLSRCSRGRC